MKKDLLTKITLKRAELNITKDYNERDKLNKEIKVLRLKQQIESIKKEIEQLKSKMESNT